MEIIGTAKLKCKIGQVVHTLLYRRRLEKNRRFTIDVEKKEIDKLHLETLSSEELKSAQKLWGSVQKNPYDYFYKFYKTVIGFDPYLVPDDVFYPQIIWSLNPVEEARILSEKTHYPIYMKDIPQPEAYILKIRGTLFDKEMNVLTFEQAEKILLDVGTFVIKPGRLSDCGNNVKLIKDAVKENLRALLSSFEDMVCQALITQSKFTASFNENSVNSLRITTLFINGKASVCASMLKYGAGESFIDNLHAGGAAIDVDEDGLMRTYGYNLTYKKVPMPWKEKYFPYMSEICDSVKIWHTKYFPTMGMIGWDVALDNNKWIMIEANLDFPGILFHQICSGRGIFGDRTKEVIEYVVNHPAKI